MDGAKIFWEYLVVTQRCIIINGNTPVIAESTLASGVSFGAHTSIITYDNLSLLIRRLLMSCAMYFPTVGGVFSSCFWQLSLFRESGSAARQS
jgi:hypothetical protein